MDARNEGRIKSAFPGAHYKYIYLSAQAKQAKMKRCMCTLRMNKILKVKGVIKKETTDEQ